ncbi:MAG: MBL fold metallo-hydrolase [Verrucomicrobiae bacterium]|nr:MBL fold metallo-hydrolase [Verrucomicrobiae bacterium]
MRITFLGTGTSTGVPMIGCSCPVCQSKDPANQRLRSSIHIQSGEKSLIVDTTTDFRLQCLRAGIDRVDAVIYTHEHADHILGVDELRPLCLRQDSRIPLYGSARVLENIRRIFPYAVHQPPPYKGLPQVDLHEITGTFRIGHIGITPFELPHGPRFKSHGFIFNEGRGPCLGYFTDCKAVPENARRSLKGIKILILDALRKNDHLTHLTLSEALEIVREIQPGHAYFTHMNHEMDHATVSAELPRGVQLAHDGLVIDTQQAKPRDS